MKSRGHIAAVIFLASGCAAFAQQTQKVTAIGVLSNQLGACAGQNAQAIEQMASLQEQLAAAKARLRELEKTSGSPEAPGPK